MARRGEYRDVTGMQFGFLTALKMVRIHKKEMSVLCRCKCGVEKHVNTSALVRGSTRSCGCYGVEGRRQRMRQRTPMDSGMHWHYLNYQRSAKKAGREFDLTKEEFAELVMLPCHYCGAEPSETCHTIGRVRSGFKANGIDRVDQGKGYTKDGNMVPCCGQCNWGKGSGSRKEFIDMCRSVTDHQDYTSINLVDMARARMEAT